MKDYYDRIQQDPEKAQPDDFTPYRSPGKFEGEPQIATRLAELEPDEDLGDVEGFGWYGVLYDVDTAEGRLSFIVHEDSQGFFSIADSGSREEIEEAWDELQDEYEESEGDDDA